MRGLIELLAFAMAAIIEGDDAPAVLGQRVNPQRVGPVDRMIGRKAMDEQDRFAPIHANRRHVHISQPNAI